MFYDSNLMNSSRLGVVWGYANRQNVNSDNIELPKICSTIEKWVDNDGSTRKRMSLRTSTLLLNGTVRLYKEELDKLYQDCVQFDAEMLYRRSPTDSVTDDNSSDSVSEDDLSRNSNSRHKRRKTKNRGNSENSSERSRTRFRSSDFESFEVNSTTSQQSQSISNTSTKINAEVQTIKSYIANKRERDRYRRKDAFDVTRPMGVVMVYNEFRPSKVICANVNENVKLL